MVIHTQTVGGLSAMLVIAGWTFLAPHPAAAQGSAGAAPAGAIELRIGPGDTVASIAVEHDVTLSQLYALNPNLNPRTMAPGDIVRLPAGDAPPALRLVPAEVVPQSAATSTPPSAVAVSPAPPPVVAARPAPPPAAAPSPRRAIARAAPAPAPLVVRVAPPPAVARAVPAPPPAVAAVSPAPIQVVPTPGNGPSISVSPVSAAAGAAVAVTAIGYPRFRLLRLLAGPSPDGLRRIKRIRTDYRGTASVVVSLPDWAATAPAVYFGLETVFGRGRTLSGPLRMTGGAG